MQKLFSEALNYIKNLPTESKPGSPQISNDDKLAFYALFKQATTGPNNTKAPNINGMLGKNQIKCPKNKLKKIMYKNQPSQFLIGIQKLNFDQNIFQTYIFLINILIFFYFQINQQFFINNQMKSKQQRSGTVRCQRCLKFGHYTYQCKNEVAYRYRPSRTVMFKQKMKLALNQDKGPQTIIKNPDKLRRIIEDKPSSEEEQQIVNKQSQKKIEQKNKQLFKLQEKDKNNQEKNIKQQQQEQQQQQQQQQQEQSISSSSSSSDQSSSSSSDSDSDQQDSQPQKKRKL